MKMALILMMLDARGQDSDEAEKNDVQMFCVKLKVKAGDEKE